MFDSFKDLNGINGSCGCWKRVVSTPWCAVGVECAVGMASLFHSKQRLVSFRVVLSVEVSYWAGSSRSLSVKVNVGQILVVDAMKANNCLHCGYQSSFQVAHFLNGSRRIWSGVLEQRGRFSRRQLCVLRRRGALAVRCVSNCFGSTRLAIVGCN